MKKTGFILLPVLLTFALITSLHCSKGQKRLEIGEAAPDFTLKNQDQMNVTLSNFKGKRNLILVFYPLDFTPV